MSITLAAMALLGSRAHQPAKADRIWGVTLDSVVEAPKIVDALRALPARMTARVVFDPETTPDDYREAVAQIRSVADVMGSPVDSAPPSGKMTVEQYRRRMASFMDGLGDSVDIWEVGNEVNGDWTGDSRTMGQKIAVATAEAKSRKKRAALCVFYSDFYQGKDREMSAWCRANLTPEVRKQLDYVLVSFYPDTVNGVHPDWASEFRRLGEVFPKAKLGFGELGLRNEDFTLNNDPEKKAALIRRYYSMPSPLPQRFIGGFFWWTFRQDVTGNQPSLLKAFQDAVGR